MSLSAFCSSAISSSRRRYSHRSLCWKEIGYVGLVTLDTYTSVYLLDHNKLVCVANLVICDCSVALQRLQKLLMFLVVLGDLLPVKVQEFSGGTQVGQSLLDRREWWVKFSTRCSTTVKTAGSVWQYNYLCYSYSVVSNFICHDRLWRQKDFHDPLTPPKQKKDRFQLYWINIKTIHSTFFSPVFCHFRCENNFSHSFHFCLSCSCYANK